MDEYVEAHADDVDKSPVEVQDDFGLRERDIIRLGFTVSGLQRNIYIFLPLNRSHSN